MSEAAIQVKKQKVEAIAEQMKNSPSMVFVDYRGITVEEDTRLRNELRAAGVDYRVIKNEMLRRAADSLGMNEASAHLVGPTACAFGTDDPVAPAKILGEFIKKTKKLTIKAGIVEGKVIDVAGVKALADLPSREVLIAKVLGSMNAPISSFVGVLAAVPRSLVVALSAICDQKQA